MALNAAALKIMQEKGLSLEDVVEIAAAMEKKADNTNAERQARYREKKRRNARYSNDVTPPNDIYSNPPVSSDDETRPVKKSKSAKPACPDGVEDQVWSDFLDHRKKKDAPVSPTVVTRIRREADKAGWTLNDAIAEVVARGWQGFKADWVDRPPGAANDGQPDRYAMIAEKYGSSP